MNHCHLSEVIAMRSRGLLAAAVAWLALGIGAAPAWAQLSRVGVNPLLISTNIRGSDTAYDPGNGVYLVVGSMATGSGTTPLWGIFVNTAGAPVTGPFAISEPGAYAHFGRVTYSPDVSNGAGGFGGFLVTWHGGLWTTSVRTRIVAYPNRLVSPERILPGGSFQETGAASAYSRASGVFMTVWQAAKPSYVVWGARIGTDGSLLGAPFPVSEPSVNAQYPSIAWDSASNRFGVVYAAFRTSDAVTGLTLVGAGGNLIRHNIFNVATGTYLTDVAFNTALGRYVAVWFQGATYGAEISGNGDVIGAGLVSASTGTYDGLGLAYNPASGTFLLAGQGRSAEIWAAELNSRGARTSADTTVTSAGLGTYYPRPAARSDAGQWNISFSHNFAALRDQVVSTSSSGGGPAGSLGGAAPPPPTGGGGSTSTSCPGTAPFPGAVCVNGGWVPGTTSGGTTSSGGCPGTAPFPGAVCVNGGWVPGTTSGGTTTSSSGCPGTAPFPGAICVNGGWVPGGTSTGSTSTGSCPGTAPFPGAVCVNGGWVPGGTSTGSTTGGCTTPDPFVAIGGGTCVNGGWVPGTSSTSTCTTPSPGTGWTCVNGGWVPPTSSAGGGCTTPAPGPGWTCSNGGWLPPTMSLTSGTTGGCTTPDPFTAMGGGICVNGGWIPRQ